MTVKCSEVQSSSSVEIIRLVYLMLTLFNSKTKFKKSTSNVGSKEMGSLHSPCRELGFEPPPSDRTGKLASARSVHNAGQIKTPISAPLMEVNSSHLTPIVPEINVNA